MSKILRKSLVIFFFIYALIFASFTFYIGSAIKSIDAKELETIVTPLHSSIYDSTNHLIENINEKENRQIHFNEVPKNLINALISIEDNTFFTHEGIDYKGVLRSILHNLTSSSRQGGSTLTQQLVKNLLLTNEISLKRKVQEAYLAYELEQNYTKEEILELYLNRIYFDATVPGISYAAKRFFNKDVSSLTLPECALLVGLVKSPSIYSPFKYPARAQERKNIVLLSMLNNNYISFLDYEVASKINVEDMVIFKGSNILEENYQYQAYLDIVYDEVKRITGFSLYDRPMEIKTYLDTTLQSYLDGIQDGTNFSFEDDITQVASAIIDNLSLGVIGVIGGRNYDGMRLYNRAYHMKRQPASTMKPIFTYALAMEYLDYHEYTMIKDEPYTYPNTNITVSNADKKYLGDISVTDALGYSRNTSTLYTLENVEKKIGRQKIIDYLNDIGLDDGGNFSYPYAIGGMTYGVSPINLASSYAILPRNGLYKAPSVIKSIKFLDTNEIVYDHENIEEKQVLSKESCYLITSCLQNVRNKNYLNINMAFPNNVNCVGKTGTNAYDSKIINTYHYPKNADRDSWFAGYSKNYSVVTWTGFDEPKMDQKTYFGSGDLRRSYSKKLFKLIMEQLENKKEAILSLPDSMIKQEVISTKDGTYLANEYVPKNFLTTVTRKKGHEIKEVLPLPTFSSLEYINIYALDKDLICSFEEINDDVYSTFYGKKGYKIDYQDIEGNTWSKFITSNECILPLESDLYEIKITETYEKNNILHGEIYQFSTFTL